MTIMQGFPPAEADRATLANWRRRPHSAWALHHVREIVPSAEISNDPGDVWALEHAPQDLSATGLDETLAELSGDAVAIIHRGRLIHETYLNGMDAASPHILFSVSKSVTGLLAGALAETGALRPEDRVIAHIPEIAGTVYEDATLRHLLDMRVGVNFDEDYLATEGPIIDYRYAANWNPVPEGREAGDLRGFMSKMTDRAGPHGGPFNYVSPNVDLLAWACERATGTRFADLLSRHLWRPLGAERPGYITVDRIGGARAAGGICFTARDLARVGAMVAANGRRDGRQVIPESWIDDIFANGDPQAWRDGPNFDRFGGEDRAYRSYWYVVRGDAPMAHGLGIHGQFLFVDRARDLSIAWFSSLDLPIDEAALPRILDAVNKVREAVA